MEEISISKLINGHLGDVLEYVQQITADIENGIDSLKMLSQTELQVLKIQLTEYEKELHLSDFPRELRCHLVLPIMIGFVAMYSANMNLSVYRSFEGLSMASTFVILFLLFSLIYIYYNSTELKKRSGLQLIQLAKLKDMIEVAIQTKNENNK